MNFRAPTTRQTTIRAAMKKANTERRNTTRKAPTTTTTRATKVPKAITTIMNTTRNTAKRVATPRVISTDTRRSTIRAMIMTAITVSPKSRRWRQRLRLAKITKSKHPIISPKKLRHPKSNTRYTYTIPRRKLREQCRWMALKSEGWTEDVIAAMKKSFQMCDVDVYLSLLLFLFTTYSRLIYL